MLTLTGLLRRRGWLKRSLGLLVSPVKLFMS